MVGVYICIVIYYNHVQAVNHQQNTLMNNKYRFLPRLYSHYLEKKAYNTHIKRVESIMNSDPIPRIKQIQSRIQQKVANSISKTKQESSKTFKLSPRAKKEKRQRQQQNLRLLNRIQKCSSTIISKSEVEQSQAKNQQLKQRMSKFVFISRSQKILLKCSHSLSKLQQRQKQKGNNDERGMIRQYSKQRYAKSQIQGQKASQENYSLSKMQNHVKADIKEKPMTNKDFQRALFRIYSRQKLQNLKDSLWNEPKKKKKKLRRKKKNTSQTQL